MTKPLPFLTDSSYVYETILGVKKSVGRYQYVILGVNPFYDYNKSTGEYTVSTTKMDGGGYLYDIKNPIYVAIRAFVCFDNTTNEVAYDSVLLKGSAPFAQCGAGQTLHERTTLTQLETSGTTAANQTIDIISSQQAQGDATFTIPSKILNRDNLPINQFNFEDWWTNDPTGIHYNSSGNAVPVGVRYTKMVAGLPTLVYLPWTTGTSLTLPSTAIIPSLQILFRSAIDERSLYVVNHSTLGPVYNPKNQVYMGVDDLDYLPYKQQDFSGTILKKGSVIGSGFLAQNLDFPSMSLLQIDGSVPCNKSDRIVFNSKQQLRDADGFKNTDIYTIIFNPVC